jgi:cobalt/nickel transport system ATP-binding protein
MSEPVARSVSVRDLAFRYPDGPAPVLDGLSLHVDASERVAVLGPNGSGKTTLALHLNGLLELQTGTITIGELGLSRQTLPDIRRTVGLLFQDPDDQLFMPTVADDVAFGPANLGLRAEAREQAVDGALAAAGVDALRDRVPHHLSGGEKRRAALATVLAMSPGVLVLDEPTSGLDPVGRRELAELLVTLPPTQLVVTHDLPLALAVCPRSVIVGDGRIVADGPTLDLLADTDLLARHRLELPLGFVLDPTRSHDPLTPGRRGG